MTNTEFKLFIASVSAFMLAVVLLLSAMTGFINPDLTRVPFQITGVAGVLLLILVQIMRWFRTKSF